MDAGAGLGDATPTARPNLRMGISQLGDFTQPDLNEALARLNSLNYVQFELDDGEYPLGDPDYTIGDLVAEYSMGTLESHLRQVRVNLELEPTDLCLGFINRRIERNLFSIGDRDNRNSVVSISDVEDYLGDRSLAEFMLIESAQHAVAMTEGHSWHREPRRCLFDYCGDKRDLARSLAYGGLCNECERSLSKGAVQLLTTAARRPSTREEPMHKVLFVSADPSDESRLAIQEEIRDIEQELLMSGLRDTFDLTLALAARPADLTRALVQRPRATHVHFSGHGSRSGEICLQGPHGQSVPVSAQALKSALAATAAQTQCVVLNSCYSQVQAEAILTQVPYVVGMSDAINDAAAIRFAIGYYQAIFNGDNVPQAFALGCASIEMTHPADAALPVLLGTA